MSIKNCEKILLAIGEIDADIIEEALIKPRNTGGVLKKLGTAAAAVALVTAISVGGSALLRGSNISGNGAGGTGNDFSGSAGDGADGGGGYVQTAKGGRITLIESGGSFVTFKLEIYEQQDRIDVTFYGMKASDPFRAISTTKDSAALTYTPVGPPKIYVDGELAASIPTAVGIYEVKFDISHLLEGGYAPEKVFYVEPFGEFYLYTAFGSGS